jgi:FkbM family methyltransferase
MTLRTLARRGAKWLPQGLRARIAEFRFGYSKAGHLFNIEMTGSEAEPVVTIDGSITLRVTPDIVPTIRYSFLTNGDSRDEIHAFMEASRALPAGAILLDIGASQGLFALLHCAINPAHRAILLEPSPSAAATAAHAMKLNGFEGRTEVLLAGAAERPIEHHVVEDGLGFAQLVPAGTPGAVPVPFISVDEEFERRGEMPAMIKIDVEGAEMEVLRGAARVVRAGKPILFLELHLDVLEKQGEPVAGPLAALKSDGYRFRTVAGDRLSPQAIQRSLLAILRIVGRRQ